MNRRQFCGLSAGLLIPRWSWGSASSERKFIFVFCDGGWDTTYLFAPSALDNDSLATESDVTVAEVNGLSFVDSASRPSVRTFLENYGDLTCFLNGIEVPSVTHDRCKRLTMTNIVEGNADDWAAILAGHGSADLLLPHLVMSGPSYSHEFTSGVIRVGTAEQFPNLISGDALMNTDSAVSKPKDSSEVLGDAYLRSRAALFESEATRGWQSRLGGSISSVMDHMEEVASLSDELAFSQSSGMQYCGDDPISGFTSLMNCFELGITRCGIIEYTGWCQNGWDTHADNVMQGTNFEELFEILGHLVDMLADRSGSTGGTMLDEVTIVVLSEMGRCPQLNVSQGKDHWTYTSAMLVGSGVQGGQVIGQMDEVFEGSPVDLASGDVTDSGVNMDSGHLGATLLALGDVDPGPYVGHDEIIEALLA